MKINTSNLLITNERGEVLLQKKDSTHIYPNVWCFFGGKIKENEKPNEALEREIMEEIGMKIRNYELLETIIYNEPEANKEGKAYIFKFDINSKDIKNIKCGEGGGFAFFEKSEIKELHMPNWTKVFLEKNLIENKGKN